MENTIELQKKIDWYRNEISILESENKKLDSSDIFDRITAVENNRSIEDYKGRIERLQSRINGSETAPTDAQITAANWATSREYDEL